MKSATLQQAIDYVLGTSNVQNYIQKMEQVPNRFAIFQISATVADYQNSIIRVIINFNEKGNPNNFNEDAFVDIQGTEFSNFKILKEGSLQVNP